MVTVDDGQIRNFFQNDCGWCQSMTVISKKVSIGNFQKKSYIVLEMTSIDRHPGPERYDLMREKTVEQKLVKAVKNRGGICPKLVCPGFDGMPDRLVLLPDGKVGFVEVKAPGEKPRPLQVSRHNLLRSLGLQVFTLDDITAIPRMLDEIGGKHDNPSNG